VLNGSRTGWLARTPVPRVPSERVTGAADGHTGCERHRRRLEDVHEDVVVDATSVGSPSVGSTSVTERLREPSSFDDLSDEMAT
jgi:hypothetical protein